MMTVFTPKEVATILRLERLTIYRMIKDGRIKARKLGKGWRIDKTEIDRLLGYTETEYRTGN